MKSVHHHLSPSSSTLLFLFDTPPPRLPSSSSSAPPLTRPDFLTFLYSRFWETSVQTTRDSRTRTPPSFESSANCPDEEMILFLVWTRTRNQGPWPAPSLGAVPCVHQPPPSSPLPSPPRLSPPLPLLPPLLLLDDNLPDIFRPFYCDCQNWNILEFFSAPLGGGGSILCLWRRSKWSENSGCLWGSLSL